MFEPSIFGENLFDDFMNDPIDRMFRFPENPSFGKREKNLMKTDVKENEQNYELDIDFPGYKKEDVSAKLEDGYLTIKAEKTTNKDDKDKKGNFIRKERFTGTCQRTFYIGDGIKQADIKASFSDGILHLDVPKADIKKVEENKYIAIQ